jgi:hypothetical protein
MQEILFKDDNMIFFSIMLEYLNNLINKYNRYNMDTLLLVIM